MFVYSSLKGICGVGSSKYGFYFKHMPNRLFSLAPNLFTVGFRVCYERVHLKRKERSKKISGKTPVNVKKEAKKENISGKIPVNFSKSDKIHRFG
ncbi:hypothetical protein J2Z40_001832 [Cytobacillus eiseniae]|uniref:Uncharacterized protein n=1 Tax=Cytobacillus eiseniae TaxID=762947 RepID=A0ABS4REE1_9BACI|nr:hypothetical protein [Cytobacillus eiseniae]MBP2241270.1 hypothetical protein [Cytobacillus eiseniae]